MGRSKLFLLIVLARTLSAAEEPIPDLNSRTSDGFLVKCYWVGSYYSVEKLEGQGVIGVWGQALSPLNYRQVTKASIIITEETDERGDVRAVVRGGNWESKVTGLHYWSRANQRVGAGPAASGGGPIPRSGEGAPAVSIERGQNTTGISLSWTESDALAFDVKYQPLEIKTGGPSRMRVEVGTKEKTERWKAKIMGMTATEEPVAAGRNTVIRQEWGSESSYWYARWIMTRVCEYGQLKLVTPRRDPRTAPRAPAADPCSSPAPATVDGQNEFTFACGSPGKVVINFKASVTPASSMNYFHDRVSFTIDPIPGSTLQWDPSNPNGKASVSGGFLVATATFNGLPAKNDDFGLKTVQLLLDGKLCEKTLVEIFFQKTATNHPGGVAGDPNWFYYWKEGGVCGIAAGDKFDATKPANVLGYSLPGTDKDVRLCARAAQTNQGPVTYTGAAPWGSQTVCGRGKGIKCAAEILEHERKHIAIHDAYHAIIAANAALDADKDNVPGTNEATADGIKSNAKDPDTFNIRRTLPVYAGYGDDEIRCRKKEVNLTIPYYPKKDWANPGCQSKNKYGP
ncbi:MAG TPA: hypothetical protein VGQ70_02770 [Candidatus Udaeobacter sp.]|nr:hypothetical protein [Candidatus Udaeobacter sp.]